MSSIQPRKGEKLVLQEDCYEDNLKNGLLTLTNQRLLFEKTEGTLATLSKRTEEIKNKERSAEIITKALAPGQCRRFNSAPETPIIGVAAPVT